jgi:hypothetical protein
MPSHLVPSISRTGGVFPESTHFAKFNLPFKTRRLPGLAAEATSTAFFHLSASITPFPSIISWFAKGGLTSAFIRYTRSVDVN